MSSEEGEKNISSGLFILYSKLNYVHWFLLLPLKTADVVVVKLLSINPYSGTISVLELDQ